MKDGLAAFGELGLTGRLRAATQAERRLQECAKLGITEVLAPAGTSGKGRARIVEAETIGGAVSAALERPAAASA